MRMTKFVETAWTVDKHFSAVHHKHTKNIYIFLCRQWERSYGIITFCNKLHLNITSSAGAS